MVAPLILCGCDDSALFQKILCDERADQKALAVELDSHELAEARAIVVADCLGVAKALEGRRCEVNALADARAASLLLFRAVLAANRG